MWREPWLWMVAGVGLAICEMFLPGFYLLGFAVGAVLTGALVWAGLVTSLPAMLFAMAVLAVAAWFAMRRWAGVRRGQKKIWHRDIND
ncbi:NfeD family protein [Paenirhodobacter sp.]|uniref:NfeD family protein n=1 Tax=Paenirhodobacter sp. TaxID=1965326 RepID=UPI003B50F85C